MGHSNIPEYPQNLHRVLLCRGFTQEGSISLLQSEPLSALHTGVLCKVSFVPSHQNGLIKKVGNTDRYKNRENERKHPGSSCHFDALKV